MSLSNVQMNSSQRDEDSFIKGVKDCIPTLLGYLSIGIAAGVIQKAAGLSIAEIALMCLILYAGSAQFIAAGMMATSSSLTAIIITIFFVNLRHILLSAALAPYFRHLSPLRNMLVGSLLTDETFGVAINETAKKDRISEKWMHGLNITAYLNWLVANLAGALLAQWISNPEKFGLEFALPAMFIGILILSMLGRNKIRLDIVVAIIAVVIAVGSSFMLSSSMGVIVATIIASTIGMVVEKWK
ncbi:AzlC family ABC transporter permease [Bacillus sp. TL12]|uniref:AzlC family ABC transporter permease n=1 Tax=Bacillus sp. TL12 TaxID=2894756 RepID=UPI001F51C514|nr:AzlC family ABC transporter permease [Bacillus sp. TL12]MCI0764102.1 AzlC family ABC transporter permease [Bacillus sp. TL12]